MENRSVAAFCRSAPLCSQKGELLQLWGLEDAGQEGVGRCPEAVSRGRGFPAVTQKEGKRSRAGPAVTAVVEAGIFIASATILRKVPGLRSEFARGTLVTWVIIIEGLSQSIYKSVV